MQKRLYDILLYRKEANVYCNSELFKNTVRGDNMKKVYNTPKAEKLGFDYSKSVVASGGKNAGVGNGCKAWPGQGEGPGKTFSNAKHGCY